VTEPVRMKGGIGVNAQFCSDQSGSDRGAGPAKPATPLPHHQLREYLERATPSPDPWSVDIGAVRAEARQRALAVQGELTPVEAVAEIDADGVPGRLYRPAGTEPEVLIWAHGGGWMHGDLDSCEGVARALAHRAECAVLTVDYRLAPEHPFPAGLDDVWATTAWAQRNFASVAVGGDSSGGNLAAAVALKARDCGLELAAQVLVYPVLDSTEDTDYKRRFRKLYANFAGQIGYGTSAYDRLEFFWQTYAPDPSARDSPLVSPLHAPTLLGVAPAVVIAAEHDFLRGEAEEYVRRLRDDRVGVELHTYRGQIHGFFEMLGVLTDAQHAVSTAGRAVRHAFDRQRLPADGDQR
jgi:acetyl esterase